MDSQCERASEVITQYTFSFNQDPATIHVKRIKLIVIVNVSQEARDHPAREHFDHHFRTNSETETPAHPPSPPSPTVALCCSSKRKKSKQFLWIFKITTGIVVILFSRNR
jgi:hypothetical protein